MLSARLLSRGEATSTFLKYFAKALQKYDLHKILDGVNMGAEMTNLRKHNAQHFPEADVAALLRGGT